MLDDPRIKSINELRSVCSGARAQLERDFALGIRGYRDTHELADKATISALKIEEHLKNATK